MKKVLHRGFKPAKCKIALQLTNSRLKILRNKKEIQIKQLRRELAQLLESGQTPTARIRVEHVVREEKTVAAYELIGIYCELLVARLGVIESQKNCPIDLKEAVASVLFASQRLSDVPEVAEIVKQLTAKYGKDFATSAIELRPDSGVSRLLVDKLSAKAPDGPTKVKILMEIASEHNVVWEAKSFMEPDPKDTELLNGASSFQSASGTSMEYSRIPNKEQPLNVQPPATASVQHGSDERHRSAENYHASDGRSSSGSNNVNYGKADHYHHHQDARPSRSRIDEGECRNPNHGDESSSSRSKHKWETEFVDSTDAARAAAEAAERASFAARAAAELSSKERMTRQDSAESFFSSASANLRNDPSHRRNRSNVQSESFPEEHTSPRRNDRVQYGNMDRTQQDVYGRGKESEVRPVEQPSEKHSLEDSRKETGREEQLSEDETEFDVGYSEDVHLRKQSSRASSRSRSSNYSDENVNNSDYVKSPSAVEENIFATYDDHRSQSSFRDIDTHDYGHDDYTAAADTYDDYSSFFDKPKFDAEDDHYTDHGVGFSLLGSKTSAATASVSFKGDHSKSHGNHSRSSSQVFQENPSTTLFDDVSTSPPMSYHEPDPYAKFDSDGGDSESDDDQPRYRGKAFEDVDERVKNLTSDRSQKFELSDPVGREFFPVETEERQTLEESDSEEDAQTGLKFGPLLGGLRNKKTLPPYIITPPRTEASSKREKEYSQTNDVGPSISSSTRSRKDLYSEARNNEKRSSFTPPDPSSSDEEDSDIQLRGTTATKTQSSYHHSRVSHDDSEEDLPTRASTRSQERTHRTITGMIDKMRTNSKTPAPVWYENEEEVERDDAHVNSKSTFTTGFSRRTKGQAKAHEKLSSPVTTMKSENKSHDRPSPKSKQVTSPDPETTSRKHSFPVASRRREKESDEQPSPKSKPVVPQSVTSPDPETPLRERASHVHPNLPDYDDIFARLGALRAPNRR